MFTFKKCVSLEQARDKHLKGAFQMSIICSRLNIQTIALHPAGTCPEGAGALSTFHYSDYGEGRIALQGG